MSHDILTIHDLAALIVQIEPEDLADLARVRRRLDVIAESSPTLVQRPIAEAVKRIEQIIERKASDPSGLFADIGVFIEEAIDAMEKSSGEKTSFLSPEERERNGKPRSETLLLKAYYSGGTWLARYPMMTEVWTATRS
jgi:hypothetical protein